MKSQILVSLAAIGGTGITAAIAPGQQSLDVLEENIVEMQRTISHTSAVALSMGDISLKGYFCAWNVDPTNYVDLSLVNDGSTPFARLRPNTPPSLISLPENVGTIYALAHTADAKIAYLAMAQPGTPS